MQLTPSLLALEEQTRAVFRRHREWRLWVDERPDRRDPAYPPLLAMYAPTGALVAVWVRPRAPRRTDKTPSARHAPAGATCVVWWPAVHGQGDAWASAPFTEPPGLFAGSWPLSGGMST